MTPPHAEIQTTTDASHLSKSEAKLFDSMNAISVIVPTTETATLTIHRFSLMSSESAASDAEYRLRMLVATGPCMTTKSTRIETPVPKAAVTIAAGSASAVTLATEAPTNASHTVGTKTPSEVDQNTFRSGVPGLMKRV